MDADRVFSSGSEARRQSVSAPLDGEIIPPSAAPKAAVPPPPPPREASPAPSASSWKSSGVLLGAVALSLIGLGAGGGLLVRDLARNRDATTAALAQLQHDLGVLKSGLDTSRAGPEVSRQEDAIRSLKKSVDTLRGDLDSTRGANASALAQLNTKFDKSERDPSAKLADIANRIDKLDQNPGAKLNDIATRLDRIERQVSSPAPTGSVLPQSRSPAAQAQQVSASLPSERPVPKPATLGTWIVRDVYDGIALVEGRSGGIREVAPGETLPGAGEVRSIERRGRAWIVVTSRGIIDDSTW